MAKLLRRPAGFCWLPIVQGRTPEHYRAYAHAERTGGLVQPTMGIGLLCRRTRLRAIREIVVAVADKLPGVRFHVSDVVLRLLQQRTALHPAVTSGDSGAWNRRFGSAIPVFNAEMRACEGRSARHHDHWGTAEGAARIAEAMEGNTDQGSLTRERTSTT